MTNREWLLNKMQNMSDEEIVEKIDFDTYIGCEHCVFKEACADRDCKVIYCPDCRINWLQQEHKEKIKLSDAERVILENIDKKYKWIARDYTDDEVCVYTDKPYKNTNKNWVNDSINEVFDLEVFNHLFQFIKWEDEQPYNIEELLKGE